MPAAQDLAQQSARRGAPQLCLSRRLVWGEQGASNALAVAQQLGFDRAVLADAKQWTTRLAAQGQESAKKGESMHEEMLVRCRNSFEQVVCMFDDTTPES